MKSAWIGREGERRLVVAVVALLGACAYVGCSFQSLDGLSNGRKHDAQNADANVDVDRSGRADVTIAGDISPIGGGGAGGQGTAGATGASDAESVSVAGGAGGSGGSAGSINDSGGVVETGGNGGSGGTETGGDAASGGGAVGGSGDAETGGSGGSSVPDTGGSGGGGGIDGGQEAGGGGTGGSSFGDAGGTDTSESPDSETPDTPQVRRSVLFVAAAVPLSKVDAVIQAHLRGKGFDVTAARDADVTSVTAVGASLVLVSRGSHSLFVNTKFRTTTVPVLVCEPSSYGDMGMVDRTVAGSSGTTSATALIVNPLAGSLAGGLSGPAIVVSTTTEEVNYGVPSAQAILVATLLNKPTVWPIFAYETDSTMFGLNAPARRGTYFFSKTSPSVLTTEGWQLFDAMVDWLTQ